MFDANEESINIKNNIFNNFTTVITNHNLRAITVASTLLNSRGNANVTIQDNLIKHHQRGIQVVNQYKANVISNTVFLDNVTPSGFYGIRVQNSATNSANNIIENAVTRLGVSSSSIETSALGVSVETGTGNIVKENVVTGFGTGIRFYNNLTSNSALCNSLVENYEGITMEDSNIGDQGSSGSASDNTWSRGTNTDAHLKAIGSSSPSIWYVQSVGSYYPNSTNDMRPTGFYTLSPVSSSGCNVPCTTPDCIQQIIARIVKEQGEFNNLDDEKKYAANKFAFEMIAKDSSLMYLNTANDSIIRVFYNAFVNDNIDLMAKVKDYLLNNDSTSAVSINSSITPENLSEENEKLFNQIYLETWGKYIFELDSTQTANLEDIAYQNPISGGESVYSARTILNLDLTDNIGETTARTTRPKKNMMLDSNLNGVVVPNPSTGNFSYMFSGPINVGGDLEIYDLIGNLVSNIKFFKGQSEVSINLSDNVSGIYMMKLNFEGGGIRYEKIILQK